MVHLTVGADGTYTYTADQSAADALDAGDTETDSFTYTISDGTTTTTATLIITVTGVNDRPTAGNETIYINENNTDASFGARTSQNIKILSLTLILLIILMQMQMMVLGSGLNLYPQELYQRYLMVLFNLSMIT